MPLCKSKSNSAAGVLALGTGTSLLVHRGSGTQVLVKIDCSNHRVHSIAGGHTGVPSLNPGSSDAANCRTSPVSPCMSGGLPGARAMHCLASSKLTGPFSTDMAPAAPLGATAYNCCFKATSDGAKCRLCRLGFKQQQQQHHRHYCGQPGWKGHGWGSAGPVGAARCCGL
jgi:hypothetical protein